MEDSRDPHSWPATAIGSDLRELYRPVTRRLDCCCSCARRLVDVHRLRAHGGETAQSLRESPRTLDVLEESHVEAVVTRDGDGEPSEDAPVDPDTGVWQSPVTWRVEDV
jgi:hypothetical protein